MWPWTPTCLQNPASSIQFYVGQASNSDLLACPTSSAGQAVLQSGTAESRWVVGLTSLEKSPSLHPRPQAPPPTRESGGER